MNRSPIATIDADRLTRDGDMVRFEYRDGFDRLARGFALRWKGEIVAYRNRCPHWSTPLDEHGEEIFDRVTGELVCQTHGARFESESGQCVSGPCQGQSLQPLGVHKVEPGRIEIHRAGLSL